MSSTQPICILSIAGSDSSGGAGIQADIRTISALGGYGATAITAITAQNTLGIHAQSAIAADLIRAQIDAIASDMLISAVKIGMLPTPASVLTTAQAISDYQLTPLVLDTVLHATTGAALSTPDTSAAIRQYLFPLTQLVTPNLDECRHYTGLAITQREHMKTAAQAFLEMGCAAVLIKGGHLLDADLTDYYLDRTGQAHWFNHARIASTNLHGTGCTLSAAIATELGKGRAMLSAIQTAIDFVQRAIHAAQHERIGQGYGPIQQGSASCQ